MNLSTGVTSGWVECPRYARPGHLTISSLMNIRRKAGNSLNSLISIFFVRLFLSHLKGRAPEAHINSRVADSLPGVQSFPEGRLSVCSRAATATRRRVRIGSEIGWE